MPAHSEKIRRTRSRWGASPCCGGGTSLHLLSCIGILLLMHPCIHADVIVLPQASSSPVPAKTREQRQEEATRAAVAALQSNNVEKARQILSSTPQEEASHPEIQVAALLFELRRPVEARHLLEKFSAVDEHAFESHQLYAELAVREGRWFDAVTHVQLAKASGLPQRWDDTKRKAVQFSLLLTEAMAFEGRHQWQSAHDVYQTAVAEQADSLEAKAGLARASFHLGELDKSAALFREVRAQQKELAPAEILIAGLFNSSGKMDETEAWYRKGIESKDIIDRSMVRLAYGDWLIFNNRPEDTIQALSDKQFDESKAAERDYLLALAFRMQQKFPDAQKLLTTLHQKDAASFPISNQLALVMIESPDESHRARALQIAESNVRNNSNLTEAWSTLGWIQFRLGDVASAEKNLTAAVQGGNVSRDTAIFMALVQERLGNSDVAEKLRQISRKTRGTLFQMVFADAQ